MMCQILQIFLKFQDVLQAIYFELIQYHLPKSSVGNINVNVNNLGTIQEDNLEDNHSNIANKRKSKSTPKTNNTKIINKYNTHHQYIEALYYEFKSRDGKANNANQYDIKMSQLNNQILKYYQYAESKGWGSFCDHHDLIPQDEYDYICQKLFDLGLKTARCIITLDTQAGGRINEAKSFDKRDIGKQNNNTFTNYNN